MVFARNQKKSQALRTMAQATQRTQAYRAAATTAPLAIVRPTAGAIART
jgi:hypothetical protein